MMKCGVVRIRYQIVVLVMCFGGYYDGCDQNSNSGVMLVIISRIYNQLNVNFNIIIGVVEIWIWFGQFLIFICVMLVDFLVIFYVNVQFFKLFGFVEFI